MQRRRFDRAFKVEAVKLVRERGVSAIAEMLGHYALIREQARKRQ